jgi:hypothetical protein
LGFKGLIPCYRTFLETLIVAAYPAVSERCTENHSIRTCPEIDETSPKLVNTFFLIFIITDYYPPK